MTLRRYQPRDEDAAVALWLRSWQAAYPSLNFAERLDWWRARWRNELVPSASITIAEAEGAKEPEIIGFVTVDPRSFYLDQIVVAPEHWASGVGTALITEAKRLSPAGPRSRRQYRQRPRRPLLPKARILNHRVRRQPDLRQTGSPHALAAVSVRGKEWLPQSNLKPEAIAK